MKLNTNWEADVHGMLTFIKPPEVIYSERRGKLLFREVYEFLMGKNMTSEFQLCY